MGKILYTHSQDILYKVCLPQHGLSFPELVLQLADELPPDQEVEQEYVEDVNDKDGPVLNILSVEAIRNFC